LIDDSGNGYGGSNGTRRFFRIAAAIPLLRRHRVPGCTSVVPAIGAFGLKCSNRHCAIRQSGLHLWQYELLQPPRKLIDRRVRISRAHASPTTTKNINTVRLIIVITLSGPVGSCYGAAWLMSASDIVGRQHTAVRTAGSRSSWTPGCPRCHWRNPSGRLGLL